MALDCEWSCFRPLGHVALPAGFRTAFALETIPEGCAYSVVNLQDCSDPGLGIETH